MILILDQINSRNQWYFQPYIIIKNFKIKYKELILECKNFKEKVHDSLRIFCYARRVISLKSDFLTQKGTIEKLIKKAGHMCIFYPKFHCELNFIERYWGACKRYA